MEDDYEMGLMDTVCGKGEKAYKCFGIDVNCDRGYLLAVWKFKIFLHENKGLNNNNNYYYMLIDVAISGDGNVIKKKAKEILKYKDLTIEIQRMWNVKTKVIPVIEGATGTISESFRKYVSNIPGKHEVKELQKTAILGTAHIVRKVLM